MRIHSLACLSILFLGAAPIVGQQQPSWRKWPGVVRVGKAKVAKDWKDFRTLPGIHRWECDAPSQVCQIQFDPTIWVMATYDQKRDITAMFGMALAYGRNASLTVILDKMTGKELATYSAESDKVRLK